MTFEIVIFIIYLFFGIIISSINTRRYAKAASQRREIIRTREGLRDTTDIWIFYLATVIFWPLVLRRLW